MQMHEASELREAYSLNQAQGALNEGWKLLAVVSCQVAANSNQVPVYVLGRNPIRDAVMAAQGTALQPVQDDLDHTS